LTLRREINNYCIVIVAWTGFSFRLVALACSDASSLFPTYLFTGMTEGRELEKIDMFLRQGLMGGKRIPVVWGGTFDLLQMLHENADIDVGEFGQATDGIVETESAEQAKTIPWAARYMKCKDEVQTVCQEEPRFCSNCWYDRDDGIKPEKGQLDRPKGQVKWHPGWRTHQLTGRNLAFALLEALQAAINIWNEGVMGAYHGSKV
jgi:hypothetical protein